MPRTSEARLFDLLDQILNVLALQVEPELSITERARRLKLAGLDNNRIAAVLNTTSSAVSVMTSHLRIKTSGTPGRKPGRKKGK
jgi:hypothetical protein